jgi:predicted lipid-binding transport protein (Tim44 family)
MKRMTAILAMLVMVLVPVLWTAEAWARAGGGSSGGSRGSRGLSSSPSSPAPVSPARPAPPATSPQPAPSRWGGLGGMLGGLLVGGLIGGLLFGHGFGGGIGLMEIVIIGGLIWLAFSFIRRRQQPAAPSGYAASDEARSAAWQQSSSAQYGGGSVVESIPDIERGIANIRQMDPDFDPKRAADAASDIFFKVQAAWMARDMSAASAVLTPEMQNILQRDCDKLRAERRINRLENIAIRSTDVTEAWQESGYDYVTVRFLANLLDYTTDESGAQVLEGSRTEPVKFEEYWTIVRPVGPNPFRLSAIQQA